MEVEISAACANLKIKTQPVQFRLLLYFSTMHVKLHIFTKDNIAYAHMCWKMTLGLWTSKSSIEDVFHVDTFSFSWRVFKFETVYGHLFSDLCNRS